jgi:hypothetical protein
MFHKKKYYYTNQKIIIRKNLLLGQIVKLLPNNRFLVSYYENNKFKYDVIDKNGIVDDDEYEIIKNRINTINKIIN